MPSPSLPTEIWMQIADEASKFSFIETCTSDDGECDHTFYPWEQRKQWLGSFPPLLEFGESSHTFTNWKQKTQWLRDLSLVNTIFSKAARRELFKEVVLDVNLERGLQWDVDILTRDHIAIHILDLCITGRFHRNDEMELRRTWHDVYTGLKAILSSCTRLQSCKIGTVEMPGTEPIELNSVMNKIFSELDFQSLRQLEMSGNQFRDSAPFWLNDNINGVVPLRAVNFTRLSTFYFDLSNWKADEVAIHHLRQFERVIGTLTNLRVLTLGLVSLNFGRNHPNGLIRLGPVKHLRHLARLDLSATWIYDSLSDVLKTVRPQEVRLERCRVYSETDRWERVFLTLLELPLKSLEIGMQLQYSELGWYCDNMAQALCTTFQADKDAMVYMEEELVRGRCPGLQWPRKCLESCTNEWEHY